MRYLIPALVACLFTVSAASTAQAFDFIAIAAHLSLVLIAQFVERLLQLGFVLFGETAIDLADLHLATRT